MLRRRAPVIRCRRCGTGCGSCQFTSNRNSALMDMQRQATSLPPVSLPLRMWAGGRFEFRRPLRVGQTYTRTSRILDVRQMEGRSGPLIFVIVRHEIGDAEGIALSEEQDIVYRDHAVSTEAEIIGSASIRRRGVGTSDPA